MIPAPRPMTRHVGTPTARQGSEPERAVRGTAGQCTKVHAEGRTVPVRGA
jgi:hypothetical protein